MGLFGKSKKEREKEYMNRLDVPLCLKEDFELIIDDVFTIMGVGTVATGNISTGMCREGENACVYKTNGGVLETIITTIDIHTKERKSNGCGYKTEHVGCALPGFVDSKNEEKTERNAGYLVVSQSGGGMLRQGTRKGIRRTPANRGMRAHRIVKSLDISEDVCHGLCP